MSQLTHYQEITLIPDPDISPYFIWQKLYTQLHIALAEIKNKHDIDCIGVSFPDYHYDDKKEQSSKLGHKLRVFAPSQNDLETLDLNKWLSRLSDYVHVKSISEVGNKATSHVVVKRYRFKPVEIQAQTLAEKLGVSYEDAMVIVKKRKPEMKVPFINMKSETTGVAYRLSILQEVVDSPVQGKFNTYGMNTMTTDVTVPHW